MASAHTRSLIEDIGSKGAETNAIKKGALAPIVDCPSSRRGWKCHILLEDIS